VILYAAQEDLSFQNGGPLGVDSAGDGTYVAPARCSLYSTAAYGGGNAIKSDQFPGGAVTSCWLGEFVYLTGSLAGTTMLFGGGQFSSANSLVVGILGSDNNGKAHLFKFDGSTLTSLAAEAGTSFVLDSLQHLDLQVTNYGSDATVNVYINGNLVITFTGDVSVSGMAGIDCIVFGPNGQPTYHSQMIAADQDTRAMRLLTQYPTGAGATDQFSGDYGDVDEVTLNDANSVYTDTVAQVEEFAVNGMPSGSWAILGCMLAVRASATAGSAVGHFKLGYNTNSSLYVDSGHALTEAWEAYNLLTQVNPVTTNPWQPTEISALQPAMESAA
jgi:hypothetical protein